MFSRKNTIVPPQQVGEVYNPIHAFSLDEYFKNRESVDEDEDGEEKNGIYYYVAPRRRGFYVLHLIFEHDDNRLINVKRYIHLVDTSPVTVSDPEILRLIGEFNDSSSNKDQIFENIVSNLDNKVPSKGGNRSRRRVQTKKKKIRKHKKKYFTKKRK